MKNKKLLAAATSVALVAVVGVGATLAYFTDTDNASNVVTMGHVDINLTETTNINEGKEPTEIDPESGMKFDNIMPGDVVSKIPRITVQPDSQNAYVRVKMDVVADKSSGITEEDLNILESNLREQIDQQNGWNYSADDDYYYYANEMKAADSVELFRTVTIPKEWKNNTVDGRFYITLTAEAIQAENFTPQADEDGEVYGWHGVTAENYK